MTTLIVQTSRLRIEAATASELDAILALEADADNADFIWQGTREQHQDEIQDPDTELLVVRAHDAGAVLGYALCTIDRVSHRYELRRIAIGPKDQGLGREVIWALMRHAFEDLGTHRFWLDVYPHNARGIHLYQSLGMHHDGTLRGNYLAADGYRDQMVFSLLRPEWEALTAPER